MNFKESEKLSKFNLTTELELLSALQKSIRRGLEYQAMYFAIELEEMGSNAQEKAKARKALWNRLRVIASEDIGLANISMVLLIDILEKQYYALRNKEKREREFLSLAILSLCRSSKSRIADEFLWVVYGARKEGKKLPIPDYVYDMHTAIGRSLGRGASHFLKEGAKINNEKNIQNPYKKRYAQLVKKYKGKL